MRYAVQRSVRGSDARGESRRVEGPRKEAYCRGMRTMAQGPQAGEWSHIPWREARTPWPRRRFGHGGRGSPRKTALGKDCYMPEQAIRFGVADSSTKRHAETWNCLSPGKREVYVFCRAFGDVLKLSLHESGRWHMAFDSKKFPAMFDGGQAPGHRFTGNWDRPAPIIQGLTVACHIYTPWDAVTIQEAELEKKVTWIAPPPSGESVEVTIFLSDHALPPDSWPARKSMKTKLVGSFKLGDGGEVWIVHRCIPSPEVKPLTLPSPKYFRGKGEADVLAGGNRMLGWGRRDDGSIFFREGPVVVSKNA